MQEKLSIVQQCVLWFWNMLSSNSGQIQILIAVVALIYAWKAYKKVLEQIDISRDQDKKNYEQRNHEIKIEQLNLFLFVADKLHSRLKIQHEIINALENSVEDFQSDEEKKEYDTTITMMENKISETERLLEIIREASEKVNNMDNFDYKENISKIKNIYEALIISNTSLMEFELIKTKLLTESD